MTNLRDILPPEDGWVGMIVPLDVEPLPAVAWEALIEQIGGETVEFTISGEWYDMGDSEPPAEWN